ncbi:hypothetical protein JG687_00014198 [Phytophthora cactorum]|uniref:Uncharacterized protein n=1 Tax=Phytophthora cactorum TaxID=29920 RepID=A0A329RGA7_9STRA|nr:hypothetical protein Pcac1_g21538 [Phytophthora cactorum]KAG2802732.1 hypothetical protein PC112_g19498 [Phytophthora cactorum]KAG2803159.1 hypothetical protein PC111_g18801 [Phytophthora cactorum]KAG2839830.1 hypothetical protein PC113_g19383 [Phytophthora cactorum]KAG2881834.1 hypothetical protein PC114_g21362 [Phytophthora cactorum]
MWQFDVAAHDLTDISMQSSASRLRGSEAEAERDEQSGVAEGYLAEEKLSAAVKDSYDSLWDDVDGGNTLEELRTPRDHDAHSIIDVLSSQLKNREIPQYLDEFEVVIPDAEVVVGAVPIEEVQQREQQVEEAKLRQAELESSLYRQREIRLAQQEALARERLLQEARRRHAELVLKDRQAAEVMQLRARRIGHVFQQAETHLTDTLKKQEARVEQLYGSLVPSRVPQSRKRYRVEWARIPLTIRIRGRMLSAVKDKLPPGQYVMVATLYDRLGGHALHWTNWDPEVAPNAAATNDSSSTRTHVGRPNFTRPFHHHGRFYNTEVAVNQDMFVVCPPEVELRPGNTLVFEVFMLSQTTISAYAGSNVMSIPRRRRRGGQNLDQTMAMQTDHVVAWGALPLTTPEFQVVQGKFKLPLLRGEMDHTMDKYQDMEKMYQADLTSWLCNFYIQVYHLPKPPAVLLHQAPRNRQDGDDPFDAEIDERGGLVRLMLPEVENNHQRYMRKMSSATPNPATIRKRSLPMVRQHSDGGLNQDEILQEKRDEEIHVNSSGKHTGGAVVKPYSSISPRLIDKKDATSIYPKKNRAKPQTRILAPTRWRWKRWLPNFNPTKKTRVYSGDAIEMQQNRSLLHATIPLQGENRDDDEGEPMLKDQTSNRQLGLDGLQVADPFDSIDEGLDISEDGENTTVKRHQQLDEENYTYAVNAAASMETARHKRFHTQRKLHYLRHELLVDLGFSNWHTLEFWRLVAMLVFACWIRLYVHYVTQWLFLRGNRIPVYDFQPRWTTCIVKYTWQTVATPTEIGLLSLGVLGNTMMFGFLSGAAALGQRYVGDLPAFGSNFVVCAGIATVLDPFLVLLVDVFSHHYGCSQLSECSVSLTASGCSCVNGDWFKLYVRFQAQEGSGLVGIFIVLILYLALTCLSLVALYVYLLYIHMNGRMLDVYRRVHGHEDAFFVPHDAEISLQELQTICAQATRWKGPRGTQRKVFVHEYALSDPLDPLFRETNTHVAVYNVELDGTRELHRHFLKMPDGAVLELFGELGANTDGNWKSDAPQGAASLALLYNILQDVQRDDNSASMTSAGLFDSL